MRGGSAALARRPRARARARAQTKRKRVTTTRAQVGLVQAAAQRHKARRPAGGPIFSPVPALGYSPPVAARPPKLPPLTSAGKGMLKVRNIGQDLKF